MSEEKDRAESKSSGEPAKPLCTCNSDPFASLPPELRPRQRSAFSDLREVKCPACGLVYWTNRKTDLCIACEKKSQV